MEQQRILKLNFSHFPVDENSAQIPGKLFLMDNFDSPLMPGDKDEFMTFPVQTTMAIFIFCRQGNLRVKINLKEYEIRTGYICTVLPGSLYQIVSVSDNIECAVMAVNTDFVDFASDVKMGIEFARRIKSNPIRLFDYSDINELLFIYKTLKHKLYQKDNKYKEEIARSYLNIMRCNAFNKFANEIEAEPEPVLSSRKEELFTQFISYLPKHYKQERNIGFYADKLCVTPKYLSSIIHEVSGRYASDWINDYVILEAKNMLRIEGRSVKDVCLELNFANQSFFAKYFKQHTNMTPKEYKNLK